MSYVVWFKDLNKDSIAVAGGKGANLGEMFNLSLPVPPGFAITAQTYQEYLERTKIKDKIEQLLKGLDTEDTEKLQNVAAKVQQLIISTPIPADIAEEIEDNYELLGLDKKANSLVQGNDVFVAVRSSATAEDLPSASFAGQQATFLNVKGKQNVVAAVLACWASLFTARAIYYRTKNNFSHLKVLICAIVQKMVNAEKSGIMFTINPSTNKEDEIVIEAIYGLGELIVGGEVNPNLYIVDKNKKTLKKMEVRKQEFGLFKNEKGDNVKLPISKIEQERQVVPDAQIQELARLGKKIEEHYGKPQDIEWAIEKGIVYIVQSRPITTFKAETGERPGIVEEEGKIILRGETASAGVYSGPVKLVRSISELNKVQKGDVLVTKMTTPDMVPAMQKAGAIVTDEGGMTCIEGEARLLTNQGFVKMSEIGDLLEKESELKTLSLDAKTKKVGWKKIICSLQRKARALEVAPYLQPSNRLMDKIRITPDHKMPFLEGDTLKSLPLNKIVEKNKNLLVIDNVPLLENEHNLNSLNNLNKQKLMYLCGSIFSDGHIVKRKSGKPMRIMFSQKITAQKEGYIKEVLDSFSSLFGGQLKNYTPEEAIVSCNGQQWSRAASFECSRAYPAQTLQSIKDNFVSVIISLEEIEILNFMGGMIDGDGYFNAEKNTVEVYLNSNEKWLIEGLMTACLRLNILPDLKSKESNLTTFIIKDKVEVVTQFCKRVKAVKSECEDRKLFDTQVFKILNINDWRGSLYNYYQHNSLIGVNWLYNYLRGHASDEVLLQIKNIADSDLRMRRLMITGETEEEIDVYNVTIDADSEENHNYVIFTKNYTPLLVYNCHAAIVSREMGTPCIVGTEHATEILKDGEIITVHASRGIVYEGKIKVKEQQEVKQTFTGGEIVTATEVKLIMDLPDLAEKAATLGADGVGLVRLEIMIANGGVHPAEYIRQGKDKDYVNLLKEGIRKIAKAFQHKPVWVRCSDIRTDEYRNLQGGEKEPQETDPMIGWHAIRRLLDEPRILKAEFQAIKDLHDEGYDNVGIMLPFVIRVNEVQKAKEIMRGLGLEPCKEIDFGVMVETPASCWIIEELCREGISFVSFGTNDLTQLTLGIDRNNSHIAKLFDEMHPAVLGEIAKVIKVCRKYHVTTSICGQAGSRPEMAEFLVHQGVDSISANADAVNEIRRVVAKTERKLLLDAER